MNSKLQDDGPVIQIDIDDDVTDNELDNLVNQIEVCETTFLDDQDEEEDEDLRILIEQIKEEADDKIELECKYMNCRNKLKFMNQKELDEHINKIHNDKLDQSIIDLTLKTPLKSTEIENLIKSKKQVDENGYNASYNYVYCIIDENDEAKYTNNLELMKYIKYIGKGTNLRSTTHIQLAFYLFKLNFLRTSSLKLNLLIEAIKKGQKIHIIKFNQNKKDEESLVLETALLKLKFQNLTNIDKISTNVDQFSESEIKNLNIYSIQNLINSKEVEQFNNLNGLENKFSNGYKEFIENLNDKTNFEEIIHKFGSMDSNRFLKRTCDVKYVDKIILYKILQLQMVDESRIIISPMYKKKLIDKVNNETNLNYKWIATFFIIRQRKVILTKEEIDNTLKEFERKVGEDLFRSIVEETEVEYRSCVNEFVNENKYFLILHLLSAFQSISKDNFLNISHFEAIIQKLIGQNYTFNHRLAISFLEHHKKMCRTDKKYFSEKALYFGQNLVYSKDDLVIFTRTVYQEYKDLKNENRFKALEEIYVSHLYEKNQKSKNKLANKDLAEVMVKMIPETRFSIGASIHNFIERSEHLSINEKNEKRIENRADFLKLSTDERDKISKEVKNNLNSQISICIIKYKCEMVIQMMCKFMFEEYKSADKLDWDDFKSVMDNIIPNNQIKRGKIRDDIGTRRRTLISIGKEKMQNQIDSHIELKRKLIGFDNSEVVQLYREVKAAIIQKCKSKNI